VGKHVLLKINGVTTTNEQFPHLPEQGPLVFRVHGNAGADLATQVKFRKILVRELAPPEPPFQPLFNGKDLTGWVPRISEPVGGPYQLLRFTEWTAEKGMVLTPLAASGYLLTDQDYWDYELQLEYKLMDAGKNPAILELAVHKGWKDKLKKLGSELLLHIDHAGKGKLALEKDGAVVRSETLGQPTKVNPLRFWNKLNLVCQGDAVKVWLNGHFLGQMTGTGLHKGLIGLKANQNDICFRNITIR
jgi:hypothetical protein